MCACQSAWMKTRVLVGIFKFYFKSGAVNFCFSNKLSMFFVHESDETHKINYHIIIAVVFFASSRMLSFSREGMTSLSTQHPTNASTCSKTLKLGEALNCYLRDFRRIWCEDVRDWNFSFMVVLLKFEIYVENSSWETQKKKHKTRSDTAD